LEADRGNDKIPTWSLLLFVTIVVQSCHNLHGVSVHHRFL